MLRVEMKLEETLPPRYQTKCIGDNRHVISPGCRHGNRGARLGSGHLWNPARGPVQIGTL